MDLSFAKRVYHSDDGVRVALVDSNAMSRELVDACDEFPAGARFAVVAVKGNNVIGCHLADTYSGAEEDWYEEAESRGGSPPPRTVG